MVELEVTVELRTPLLLGARKQGTVVETLNSLPGAMLRGALGRLLARRCGHPPDAHVGCDFAAIFRADVQPRFGPCYPAQSEFSAPFPATARQCKYYPGFKAQDKEAHGIHDALIPLYAYEEVSQHQWVKVYQPYCRICNAKLEPVTGFYESLGNSYWQPRPRVRRLSRTAINRRRRVAAEKLLYTLELLSERMSGPPLNSDEAPSVPTRLRGKVWAADDAQAERLLELLPQVTQLGGGTSRGLGVVTITVEPRWDTPPTEPSDAVRQLAEAASDLDFERVEAQAGSLTHRLARFNAVLLKALREYPDYRPPAGRLYFTVDCLSDVVWLNGGLPTALLPEQFAGARRARTFSLPRRLSGFSGATGLMRTPQLAAGRGSVFLYCLDNATPEAVSSMLAVLQMAESDGLGRDRERGCGWVQICSPFHLEVMPK
ncbi:MAG: CRISPR-associated RAMP protein Csx10 [Chloroflexi bacterium]|nr:MAG: CRISPR-associated RAMP protein Csx10 [Chloroflexota bacterium]